MPWLLLGLIVIILAWLIVKLIRRLKKEKKEETKPVVSEPAHVIAFRELSLLRDEQLWQKGETKKYYIRLTGIVRQYLENRYSVNSLEMTTSETLDALVKNGFKKNSKKGLMKGPYKKINADPIPALGESPGGASYEYIDTDVQTGKRYWYMLEDVDLNETERHHGPCGPVSAWEDCSYEP